MDYEQLRIVERVTGRRDGCGRKRILHWSQCVVVTIFFFITVFVIAI